LTKRYSTSTIDKIKEKHHIGRAMSIANGTLSGSYLYTVIMSNPTAQSPATVTASAFVGSKQPELLVMSARLAIKSRKMSHLQS
jgi:hypothetical protein